MEPLLSFRISETIKENITDYYKAFRICNDPHNLGDLTPFLIMLLNMIYEALVELQKSLAQRLHSWNKYEALVSKFPEASDIHIRNLYSYLIQATLFSEKGISTEELKNVFKESYYTIKKYLDEIPFELLRSEKHGRAKYYQIDLSVLDNMLLNDRVHQSPDLWGDLIRS